MKKLTINVEKIYELVILVFFIGMLSFESPFIKSIVSMLFLFFSVLFFIISKTSKQSFVNITKQFLWLGAFVMVVYLSKIWSFINVPNSPALEIVSRGFVFSLFLVSYMNSEERIWKVLDLFTISCTIFSVIYITTSPVSTWGNTLMGGITGQFRNYTGHIISMSILMQMFLYKHQNNKKYLFFIIISLFVVFMTGSRGALLSLFLMISLFFALNSNSFSKKIQYVFVGLIIALLGIIIVYNNEYLYKIYGTRLLAIFVHDARDISVSERGFFIEIGIQMFKNRPILGWGVDNFAMYLSNVIGYSNAVYSHNNYIEILSSFGIVGFIIYYYRYLFSLKHLFFNYKKNLLLVMSLILLIRFIIFEYATISFEHYEYIFILSIIFTSIYVLKNKNNTKNIDIINGGKHL